jgi:hypothetical protein
MGAISFDLLVRGDGAEDYFGELAAMEGAVGDASVHKAVVSIYTGERTGRGTYPTTSRGFLTMAMLKWVRSYTSRAM